MIAPVKPICLPPAPSNGGPLEHAPVKIGQWVWQPKVDDWRCVIHVPSRTVWNQYGKLSTVAEQDKLRRALDYLQPCGEYVEWLDAGIMENRHDLMRGCIIVFDLIEAGLNYDQRRAKLSVFPTLPLETAGWLKLCGGQARDSVYLVSDWLGDPLKLWFTLKHENTKLGRKFYEGVVAKKIDAAYPTNSQSAKTKTPFWIKHRFDQDALDPLAAFRSLEGVTQMLGQEVYA